MKKKDLYTSPEVTVFTVQTEGVVCGSPDPSPVIWGVLGAAGGDPGLDDDNYNYGSF